MSLSRRHFVHLTSLSLLAGAALPSAFGQMEAEDETFSPENMASFDGISRQIFEPYVRERFTLSRAGKSLGRLTLIEVSELTSATTASTARGALSAGRALTSFALRFQGSGGQLPQETYLLEQRALGKFPLLLVPAAPGAEVLTYTAIFTRFATAGTLQTEA
ncbi:MAG: hypothetical protein ABSC48_10570 [Terracidiphilus sp.]|jgi:hypothetical protein